MASRPTRPTAKKAAARKTTAKKTAAKPTGRPKYTDAQRAQALDLYVEHGPAEAERRTGIPRKTIASWARRAGVQSDAPAKTAAATEAAKLTLEQRKTAMADRVLDEAGRLLDQLFAATVEKRILSRGDDGYVVATADRAQPTFSDQRHIVWSAAVLIDKAVKLTGGDRLNLSVSSEPDQEVEAVAAEVVSLAWARQQRDTG